MKPEEISARAHGSIENMWRGREWPRWGANHMGHWSIPTRMIDADHVEIRPRLETQGVY